MSDDFTKEEIEEAVRHQGALEKAGLVPKPSKLTTASRSQHRRLMAQGVGCIACTMYMATSHTRITDELTFYLCFSCLTKIRKLLKDTYKLELAARALVRKKEKKIE